jgi:translation initiation factor 3 subunit G
VVEYRKNELGQRIKVIRKVKQTKKLVKVNKHVVERRKWKKFGDCKGLPDGPENNITNIAEAVKLELSSVKKEEGPDDLASRLSKLGDTMVVCRNCGESGHWTLKCPKRSQAGNGSCNPFCFALLFTFNLS